MRGRKWQFLARYAMSAERFFIFQPRSDRARELYMAATQEKIALIRFLKQNVQDAAIAYQIDRLERREWLQDITLLRDGLQHDLIVSRALVKPRNVGFFESYSY